MDETLAISFTPLTIIKNDNITNKVPIIYGEILAISLIETVIVLVLRLLYQKGSLDINSSSDITTTLGKLMTEINQTGIFKNQISKTEYLSVLRLMKRYKIIDYDFNSNDYEEDNVIYIFPTVLYVVKINFICNNNCNSI